MKGFKVTFWVQDYVTPEELDNALDCWGRPGWVEDWSVRDLPDRAPAMTRPSNGVLVLCGVALL